MVNAAFVIHGFVKPQCLSATCLGYHFVSAEQPDGTVYQCTVTLYEPYVASQQAQMDRLGVCVVEAMYEANRVLQQYGVELGTVQREL